MRAGESVQELASVHAVAWFQADVALLVVSAAKGEYEAGVSRSGQTREHALLAYTLGVKQIIVCVNKMDLTEPPYSQTRFDEVMRGVSGFLKKIGYDPTSVPFVPVSGWTGENMITAAQKVRTVPNLTVCWRNPSDGCAVRRCPGSEAGRPNEEKGTRVGELCWRSLTPFSPQCAQSTSPYDCLCRTSTKSEVPDAIRSPRSQTQSGKCALVLKRREKSLIQQFPPPGVGTVPVGKIETGVLKPGMTLKFSPAKLTAEVKSIEMHHQGLETALPGHNVGFNIKNVSVKNLRRGDVAGNAQQDPPSDVSSFEAQVGSSLRCSAWILPGVTFVFCFFFLFVFFFVFR